MITFIISLVFTLALFASFYYGGIFVGIMTLLVEIVFLSLIPLFIKSRKEVLKKLIESESNDKPILNVNKDPWYYLVELPEVSRIEAKRIVHIRRKYGKYNSIEDFFVKNMIDIEKREKIQKYIKI